MSCTTAEPVTCISCRDEVEKVVIPPVPSTSNKDGPPLDTLNGVPVEDTEADTKLSAIRVRLSPTIPEAGMLVNPPPFP